MDERVLKILEGYQGENAGVRANLARIANHGTLGGTGKFVMLPVDQGFEHGPARSFAPNPPGYDPTYHVELAIEAGCNAHAAPLGAIRLFAHRYAGEMPLILKLNNHEMLVSEDDPMPSLNSCVKDALQLGCAAIGFSIYPGSKLWHPMNEQLQRVAFEARDHGLVVVVWSYPRGTDLSKEGETAIDVVAYAAQIASQMGAHIIKVKVPTDHIEQDAAKKVYEACEIPIAERSERIRHVVQSAFDGQRIVIFSGGAKKDDIEEVYAVNRDIHKGGGFGTIIGRNSFQRPRDEGLAMLRKIMSIYRGEE